MISCSNQIDIKKSYNENNFIYKAETRLIETLKQNDNEIYWI